MLQYHPMIQNASSSGQAQAVHRQSENPAMARSSTSLASGLGHLVNLGKDPLALLREVTTHTEAPGDKNASQSDSSSTDDRQAVEQELQRYEDDGLSDITSPVAFWQVGIVIPQARVISRSHGFYYRNMNVIIQHFSALQWTYCQHKRHLFHVRGCSRQVRKHAPSAAASLAPPQWRCSKS